MIFFAVWRQQCQLDFQLFIIKPALITNPEGRILPESYNAENKSIFEIECTVQKFKQKLVLLRVAEQQNYDAHKAYSSIVM